MTINRQQPDIDPNANCRCTECAKIHEEFITNFNKWPTMTHEQGQELKARRIDNEKSFDRMLKRGRVE